MNDRLPTITVDHFGQAERTRHLPAGSFWLLRRERCDTCLGVGNTQPRPGCAPCSAGCLNGWQPANGTIGTVGFASPADPTVTWCRRLSGSDRWPEGTRVLVVPAEQA